MLSSTGQSAVLPGPLSQALGAPRWQGPWQHSLTLGGTPAQGEGTGLHVFLSPGGKVLRTPKRARAAVPEKCGIRPGPAGPAHRPPPQAVKDTQTSVACLLTTPEKPLLVTPHARAPTLKTPG